MEEQRALNQLGNTYYAVAQNNATQHGTSADTGAMFQAALHAYLTSEIVVTTLCAQNSVKARDCDDMLWRLYVGMGNVMLDCPPTLANPADAVILFDDAKVIVSDT